MATLEIEDPATPTFTVVERTTRAVGRAAGTDERLSPRALVGLLLLAPAIGLAPTPLNVIAIVGLVILAIEMARLAWRK